MDRPQGACRLLPVRGYLQSKARRCLKTKEMRVSRYLEK